MSAEPSVTSSNGTADARSDRLGGGVLGEVDPAPRVNPNPGTQILLDEITHLNHELNNALAFKSGFSRMVDLLDEANKKLERVKWIADKPSDDWTECRIQFQLKEILDG